MCEQCAEPELDRTSKEAIRACPRLKSLGEPTIDWLVSVAAQREQSTPTAPTLSLRIGAALLLCLAMVLEAVGGLHQIIWEEWRGGASLGLMVLGCFLLLLSRHAADG